MHLTTLSGSHNISFQQQVPVEKPIDGKASKVVFIGGTKMRETGPMILSIQYTEELKSVPRYS